MLYFCLEQWETSVQKSRSLKSQNPVGAGGLRRRGSGGYCFALMAIETVNRYSFSFWCVSMNCFEV